MSDESKITAKEIADDLLNPFVDFLEKGGITDDFLVKQLKKEFRSKEPKIIKVKGAVSQNDLPPGFKLIATSGTLSYQEGDDGQEEVYGSGDSIIQYKVHNIGISQRARMDVHKLKGHYPAEKHEHSGQINVIPQLTDEDREMLKSISSQVVNEILQQHREAIKPGS
jgi:hypothetical protein